MGRDMSKRENKSLRFRDGAETTYTIQFYAANKTIGDSERPRRACYGLDDKYISPAFTSETFWDRDVAIKVMRFWMSFGFFDNAICICNTEDEAFNYNDICIKEDR